jgi:ribosome biogenesis protein Nip4
MKNWISLPSNEVEIVIQQVNAIWDNDIMTQLLYDRVLVKREGERSEVYLVPRSDLPLLNQLVSSLTQLNGQLVYAKTKLGFFIKNQFHLGIESLRFLLSVSVPTTRKLVLQAKEAERIIYGKDLKKMSPKTLQQLESVVARGKVKETPIIVLSRDQIPLGLVSYRMNGDTRWLLNIIDVGIYLRAEKTAF